VAQERREQIGVDLYGVQQQLAKLQMNLEKIHDSYGDAAKKRAVADENLVKAKEMYEEEKQAGELQQTKVDKFQAELDKLSYTLKQIENYSEQMKNEIAVTRRATYVAEETMSKMEKEKEEQDILIDNLQETLKRQHQQHQMFEAQLIAQVRETKVAQETLQEAQTEMESINFEKKQLANQWKSSLIAMARRDEALQATEEALQQQGEQEMAIEGEIEGYKKSIKVEQQKNEQLTGILKKVEGEEEFLKKQQATIDEKSNKLRKNYASLKKSQDTTDKALNSALFDKKLIEQDMVAVDKSIVKTTQENQELESEVVLKLSEQVTIQTGSQKTSQSTIQLRQQVKEEEITVINLQNEHAKIGVDILNTDAHNANLMELVKSIDNELKEKTKTIGKYEQEIKRRNDEIEKKTNEVDKLNRAYEKLTANMEDEDTGPLEATIKNLKREINQKTVEGKHLQKRWITVQTQLVALQMENNTAKERVQRLHSEQTVLTQKRNRLVQQHDHHGKEIKRLDQQVNHMHTDMAKLNQLIAKNTKLQADLANDNFNLETKIINQLKELENETILIETKIEQTKEEKRDILAEIVELERQIMLWERKIKLEKETQAAIDPNIGNSVVTAMKKEIHRMKLRHSELLRYQEKLINDMERAIYKRETIATKGKAGATKKSPHLTEAQLRKQTAELRRSVKETEAEARRAEEGILELERKRDELAEQMDTSARDLKDIVQTDTDITRNIIDLRVAKTKTALQTAHKQHVTKYLQDFTEASVMPLGIQQERASEEIEHLFEQKRIFLKVVEQLAEESIDMALALSKTRAVLEVEVDSPN